MAVSTYSNWESSFIKYKVIRNHNLFYWVNDKLLIHLFRRQVFDSIWKGNQNPKFYDENKVSYQATLKEEKKKKESKENRELQF